MTQYRNINKLIVSRFWHLCCCKNLIETCKQGKLIRVRLFFISNWLQSVQDTNNTKGEFSFCVSIFAPHSSNIENEKTDENCCNTRLDRNILAELFLLFQAKRINWIWYLSVLNEAASFCTAPLFHTAQKGGRHTNEGSIPARSQPAPAQILKTRS